MQSRLQSAIETCVGVAIGYFIALLTQVLVFPLFHLKVTLNENLLIGGIFTIVALIRSYFLRRLFNHLHRKKQ